MHLDQLALDHRRNTARCVYVGWVLGTFLLAFCRDRLGRGESCYVAALTTIAITTHLSHVPIALRLVLLAPALQFVLGAKIRLRRIMLLGGILSIAIGSMLAVNWVNSGNAVFAGNSNVFLLARWIDEGPARTFLQKACNTEHYKLCAHLDELKGRTHDDLKWLPDSPFLKVGGFDALEPEAREIVRGTLRVPPGNSSDGLPRRWAAASALQNGRWPSSRLRALGGGTFPQRLQPGNGTSTVAITSIARPIAYFRNTAPSSRRRSLWIDRLHLDVRAPGRVAAPCHCAPIVHRRWRSVERDSDRRTIWALRPVSCSCNLARLVCWHAWPVVPGAKSGHRRV